jgi:hypothetical protein
MKFHPLVLTNLQIQNVCPSCQKWKTVSSNFEKRVCGVELVISPGGMKSQFNIFFLFRHIWCRHRVKDVADRLVLGATVESLKSNMLLAPVVMWMEQAGVIEHGHLASNFVTLTTSLSKPTCCPSCDSRLGIKHSLEQDGWRKVETVREASVVDKCFSHVGPLEYFQLLKHHAGRLLEYEEMFPFRHSQGKGYYDCFLVFFQNRPAEACNQSFGL